MTRMLLCSPTLMILLILSGCARPKEDTKYVIVGTGDPVQAIADESGKNTKIVVTGSTLKGGNVAKQDVSGWVMMPPGHWTIISAQLEKDKAEGRLLTK